MTSNYAERPPEWPSAKHLPVKRLVRRRGIRPIESVDELARPGTFESDEELHEFLANQVALVVTMKEPDA